MLSGAWRVPALLAAALASCAAPHDWPMFGRDASRNAVSPEKDPPTDWSAEEGKERNLAWKADLGTLTFAAPVVAGGLVWVGTNHAYEREGDADVLLAFRERDGKLLWKHLSPRGRAGWDIGNPPWMPLRCSPLVEGDRLWFTNNRWEVVCLDAGPLRRGAGAPREVWKVNLTERLGTQPRPCGGGMGMGVTCSIGASHAGRLYVSTGHGFDWDPLKRNPDAPALVCLDRETGEILGREASGIAAKTLASNLSSPVATRLPDGRTLVIFGGGDGWLHAFDPVPADDPARPGRRVLNEIWKVDCRPADPPTGITATPLVHRGRAYVAVGQADAQGPGRLSCVDLASGALVWSSTDVGSTMSTAVVQEGLLILPDLDGFVHALDAETGKLLWRFDALSPITASPLWVDGKLYACNADGEVLILDARALTQRARRRATPLLVERERRHLVLSRPSEPREGPEIVPSEGLADTRTLPGGLYASPVFANGTLYVAADRRLYAIRRESTKGAGPDEAPPKRGRAPDALFVPTPRDVVEKMLELAEVKETDVLYDLGSGDGRIVIAAAKGRGARAVGYEIDRALVDESRREIAREGLADRATIVFEDLLKADLSEASVVTLYVGSRLNRLLVPKLRALRPGTRIISHDFGIQGAKPPRESRMMKSAEDGREHTLYLWTAPLMLEEPK